MAVIDAIGLVFPGYAARYLMRRSAFEAARKYEAATMSNYRPGRASIGDGDAQVAMGAEKLRGTARYLDENHDLVVGIFDDLVNNTIADGVMMGAQVRDKGGKLHTEFNRALDEAYDEWCRRPETTGDLTMTPLERLVARSLFREGEIFTQLIRDPRFRYQGQVPFVVDTLEADFCPLGFNDDKRSIVQGIERDQWGAARGFWFYKNHPGRRGAGAQITTADLVRRDAATVLHAKLIKRLKQGRGVSVLHAVIERLRDIKDYEESERIAAKVAADLTGFIERTDPAGFGAVQAGAAKNRQLKLQAGAIFELNPGEKVGTISSDRPNTGLEAFRNAMLAAVAAGTGTRSSSISKNYDHTYSAQRQELVEGAVGYRALFAYIVGAWHEPIRNTFTETAVLSGMVQVPRDVDRRTLYRCEYQAPALPWIDPNREAQAWKTLREAKLESIAGIARMRGRDVQRLFDELDEEEAAGFGMTSATPAASGAPAALDANGDPVDQNNDAKAA